MAIGCEHCGKPADDLRDLHWHHISPENKVDSVANMIGKCRPVDVIYAEIAKTVCVHEHCHREIHAAMRAAAA